jgi:hypothetical protein
VSVEPVRHATINDKMRLWFDAPLPANQIGTLAKYQ